MLHRAVLLLALALPLAAACAAPPAPQTPEKAAEPAPAEAPGKSMMEVRREFIGACNGRAPGAPDYCECSWEQAQKIFSLADLNAPQADKTKLAQLKDRVEATCRAKLPEDSVKAVFTRACMGDAPKLADYCECNWTVLRRTLSAAELSDEATTKDPRFIAATKETIKACGAKMPEDVAREAFLKGCASEKPLEPFCGCAWKSLRTAGSAAEVLGGVVDIEAQRPKFEKACGKLRPAK
jgi:hypothetical protein